MSCQCLTVLVVLEDMCSAFHAAFSEYRCKLYVLCYISLPTCTACHSNVINWKLSVYGSCGHFKVSDAAYADIVGSGENNCQLFNWCPIVRERDRYQTFLANKAHQMGVFQNPLNQLNICIQLKA